MEKDLLTEFQQWLQKEHPSWRVKTEVPVGDLVADGRVEEVEGDIVKDVICYFEIKGEDADLKELLTGLSQAQYYREQTLRESWLILRHDQLERLMAAKKKSIGGIKLFDLNQERLIGYETVAEAVQKSRMKRAQEATIQTWKQTFKIETTSPIAITSPEFNGEKVIFNLGARIRGMLKEIAKTISPSLSDAIKYGIYVEPTQTEIAEKKELKLITKFVPTNTGQSSKRELYEVQAGKTMAFTIRCIGKRLSPELIEDLLRQSGTFTGIGDSHSDGYHGRFTLTQK